MALTIAGADVAVSSLASGCYSVVKGINELRQSWKYMPMTLSSMVLACNTTSSTLKQVDLTLANYSGRLEDSYGELFDQFDGIKIGCAVTPSLLEKHVSDLLNIPNSDVPLKAQKTSATNKMKALYNESDMKELFRQLNVYITLLNTIQTHLQSQTDERSHPEITVGIYEITTGKRVGRLSKVDSISVRMLAFMRNDRQLVCCSPGRVEIWDLTTYTLVQKWSFRRRCFRGAIVTPDRILVCGASDGLTMMDLRSGVITACVSGLGLIHRLAYAPATKGIAFTTWSGSVGVWNPSTGCVVHLSPDDTQKFDRWPAVAIAPDGQAVFYGGVDGMVRVWYINN